MALDGNPARFLVNGLPSEDVNGNRGVVVNNGQLLTLILEVIPSPALSALFQVFDAADPSSPLASLEAPLVTFNASGTASELLNDPDTQSATINMVGAGVDPNTDIHSYLVRCTVSTPDGPFVFEREVVTRGASADLRKTVPAESQEMEARGWSDELNRMVDAIEAGFSSIPGTTWVSLSDTPGNFVGQYGGRGGAVTRVNVTETALEFTNVFIEGGDLTAVGFIQADGDFVGAKRDGAAQLRLEDINGGVNEKIWALVNDSTQLQLRTLTDVGAAGQAVFTVDRTGTVPSDLLMQVDINLNTHNITGASVITGSVLAAGLSVVTISTTGSPAFTGQIGAGENNPIITLDTTNGAALNGGLSNIHVVDRTPEGNVTADGGAIAVRDDGVNSNFYLKTEDGTDTGWVSLIPGGGVPLQTVYTAGNNIDVTTANGPVEIENSTDVTDLLTLDRTFADVGEALSITMGAGSTGIALKIVHAGPSGTMIDADATGPGANLLSLKRGGVPVFEIDDGGGVVLSGLAGELVSLSASGAGIFAAGSADGLATFGSSGSGDAQFVALGTGNALVDAVAGEVRLSHAGGITRVLGDWVIEGATISADVEVINVADNHLYLNAGYETVSAQTGGWVVNTLPIATTDTVAATGFVAGVDAVSNPTVNTVGAATYTVGQLIQIAGAANEANNGLYEVLTHAANLLTIRGVGLTGRVEDFTQNQFTTDTDVAGTITRLNVGVLRVTSTGVVEALFGSVTPLATVDASFSAGVFTADTQFTVASATPAPGFAGQTAGGEDVPFIGLDTTGGGNGGLSAIHVGDRTPEGNVTANGGALFARDDGADSTVYVKRVDGTALGWWDLLNPVISDYSAGTSTSTVALSSSPTSKASITIPAENATFVITAKALVSQSNLTGQPSIRIQNTTDTTTLNTRNPVIEVKDTDMIVSVEVEVEFVQTVGAGAKVVDLEFGLLNVSGTMTISDARITAKRKY